MPTLQDNLNEINSQIEEIDIDLYPFNKVAILAKKVSDFLCLALFLLFITAFVLICANWGAKLDGLTVLIFYFLLISLVHILQWVEDKKQRLKITNLIYRIKHLSKEEYTELSERREQLKRQAKGIEYKIEYSIAEEQASKARAERVRREHGFVKKLEGFIETLSKHEPSNNQSIITLLQKEHQQLYDEYVSVKVAGFTLHNNLFYTNRFDIISKHLNRISGTTDSVTTPTNTVNPIAVIVNTIPNKKVIETNNDEPTENKMKTNTLIANIGSEDYEQNTELIFDKYINSNRAKQSATFDGARESLKVNVKISPEQYLEQSKNNQDLGLKGEIFVLNSEKNKLLKANKKYLADKVRHLSLEVGDSIGYDILSFDEDGNEKFIEVKTSKQEALSPFYLTENELSTMKRLDNYFIYRVFNFDEEIGKGKFYVIDCKRQFDNFYKIEAISYKISPNSANRK